MHPECRLHPATASARRCLRHRHRARPHNRRLRIHQHSHPPVIGRPHPYPPGTPPGTRVRWGCTWLQRCTECHWGRTAAPHPYWAGRDRCCSAGWSCTAVRTVHRVHLAECTLAVRQLRNTRRYGRERSHRGSRTVDHPPCVQRRYRSARACHRNPPGKTNPCTACQTCTRTPAHPPPESGIPEEER